MFDNVGKVHEMYPDKTCFTEGCVEKFDYSKLQRWANGSVMENP
jgi:glucosylceramidase